MRPGLALILASLLVLACTVAPGVLPIAPPEASESVDPEPSPFVLPTASDEDLPSEPPAVTIPPGFEFPAHTPMTEGNADLHAQKALFERTGSLCFTHYDVSSAGDVDYEAMASRLAGTDGLLDDGRSYVGPLEDALAALDLEPTDIAFETVAYGIGVVTSERATPQLPTGATWAPRLELFKLADGRTGWSQIGPWIAVVDRQCAVVPN
jgi:hypothetical protein